ncbi:MAG: HI1506-related protein [Syntrophales bacterium]
MIRIKSKQNNFRRCGMPHPDRAIDYPDGKFTAEQLAILKAEPMLIVEVVREKAAEGAGADLAALTVEQLKAAIANYQPVEPLKGLRKAELVEILKAHLEAAAKKE